MLIAIIKLDSKGSLNFNCFPKIKSVEVSSLMTWTCWSDGNLDILGHVTRGNFSRPATCNATNVALQVAKKNNCPYNTPFSQLAIQQNFALQEK